MMEHRELPPRMKQIIIGFIGFFVALHVLTLDSLQVRSSDYAGYLLQAECLLAGEVSDCKEDGERRFEFDIIVGPDVYPWGYPIILAAPLSVFGMNVVVFKLINVLFYLGGLWLLHRLLAGWLSQSERLLIVLVLISSFYFYWAKQSLLSEFPAFFFVMLALWGIKQFCVDGRRTSMSATLIGLGVFAAFFIRSSNIMLLPALWFAQFVARKPGAADRQSLTLAVLPTLVFFGLWFGTNALLPSSSYLNHLDFTATEYLEWVRGNLPVQAYDYALSLGELIGRPLSDVWSERMWGPLAGVMSGWSWFTSGYALFLVGTALFGLFKRGKEEYAALLAFFVTSAGLLFLYPVSLTMRGIIPLLPIALFLAFLGMRYLDDRYFTRSNRPVVGFWFTTAHVLISLSLISLLEYTGSERVFQEAEHSARQEVFAEVSQRYGPEDTVSFYRPRELQLETGVFGVATIEWNKLETGEGFDPRDYPEVDGFIVSVVPIYEETVHRKFDGVGVKVFENERYALFDTRITSSDELTE